jgi:hypothetical protein
MHLWCRAQHGVGRLRFERPDDLFDQLAGAILLPLDVNHRVGRLLAVRLGVVAELDVTVERLQVDCVEICFDLRRSTYPFLRSPAQQPAM